MTDTIATRFVAARRHLTMTQEAFCTHIGLPLSTLKKYEGGHSTPRLDALEQMLAAGFSVNWLIAGEGPMLLSQAVLVPAAKINEDALVAAFVGMVQAAPAGEPPARTAKKAIEFYSYLLEKGMITPDGIGEGKLGNAA